MKRLLNDIKAFCKSKAYMAGLTLTAVCAYGYAITHYAIGMDDTAIPLYFEEGLAPYVGRWSLFVLNKIFHFTDFAPWIVELISVLLLMLAVTLWCILWKRICEPRIVLPVWSYLFVAGIFISCPLISEIFVFYLHNGICLGYGVTAFALLCFMNGLSPERTKKYRLGQLSLSAALLAIALGFYESFLIVYIMGAVMCFFLIRRLYGKNGEGSGYSAKLLPWLGSGILIVLGGMSVRMAILAVLKAVYHLDRLSHYNVLYRSLFGDIFKAEGELLMVLKRFFVKYYVNALVYLPVAILVAALVFVGIYSLYSGIRRRDIFLPVCAAVLIVLPILMSLVEGLATRYRSAQYVPVVGAFAVLLAIVEIRLNGLPKWVSVSGIVCLGVLLLVQCADMNRWFRLDYLKYQDAREVMDKVANDLEAECDISKPIVFRGAYPVPYEIAEDAYVGFSSRQYQWICRLTDWLDPHLKEKYFGESGRGYVFAETPVVSILQWGATAFDGTSGQLIEFWRMHGYDAFSCETDLEVIEEAEQIRMEEKMPGYPNVGYIMECEDYIIVNFASAE